jgi:hypothetical protein
MEKKKYFQYIKDFNKGDFDKWTSTWFTKDVILQTTGYRGEGREEVTRHLIENHKGLRETLRVEDVLIESSRMAVVLCVDWYCTEDRPDFRIRPMKKGDLLKLRMFAFYDTKGGKISRIRLGLAPQEPGTRLTFS